MCLKETIEKILLKNDSNQNTHQYQNDQAIFLQIDSNSETNADDYYQTHCIQAFDQTHQHTTVFNSVNRNTPILDNEPSKAKSSLIKRGSLASRQPPQQTTQPLNNNEYKSNKNSNMLFDNNLLAVNAHEDLDNQQFNK